MPSCTFHPVTVLCCYNLQVFLRIASSAGVELCHFVRSQLSRGRNEQSPDISQVRVFCGVFLGWVVVRWCTVKLCTLCIPSQGCFSGGILRHSL